MSKPTKPAARPSRSPSKPAKSPRRRIATPQGSKPFADARKAPTRPPRKTAARSKPLPAPRSLEQGQRARAAAKAFELAAARHRKAERAAQLVADRERKAAERARERQRRAAELADKKLSQAFDEARRSHARARKGDKDREKLNETWKLYAQSVGKIHSPQTKAVFEDMVVELGLLASRKHKGTRHDSVEVNGDGTVDGQVFLPGAKTQEELERRLLPLLRRLDPRYWIRIGFRYEIMGGAQAWERYQGQHYANVQPGWSPAGDFASHLLTQDQVQQNMQGASYGHRVLGTVLTLHWNPWGTKPDRR